MLSVMHRFTTRFVLPFLVVYVGGLCALFLYKEAQKYPDYVIPSPSLVTRAFLDFIREYTGESVRSILISLAGYVAAMLASFIAAGLILFAGRLSTFFISATATVQSFPLVALAPIFFIIFGEGVSTCILISGIICYFPMLLALVGALASPIDEVEHFFESSNRLDKLRIFKIRLLENTESLVSVFVGCVTLAVVGAVVAEFLSMNAGIGFVIRTASDGNKLDRILVALFSIGLINCLLLWLVDFIGSIVVGRIGGKSRVTEAQA